MSHPDIVVIGGGIIGAAVARSLALAGLTVAIIDSGTEQGIATQASAGMLAPLAETDTEDPVLGISVRGRDIYTELAPQLEEETGVDIGLWCEGIMKVAFSEADEDATRSLIAWQRQQGLNSEWLVPGELRERCPGISDEVRGALLAPEDGALDPLSLLEALLVSAANLGTRITRGVRAERLQIEEGHVTGVETDRGAHQAGAVVLAAGAWSGRLGGLPRPLSVEPVRGQMLAFEWPADEPAAIVYTGKGYALKRGAEMVVGSTMEHTGYDASVTPDGIEEVTRTAAQLYPAVAEATLRRSWAGLRPATPDGRPIVGKDPDVGGLWYATGHGRNGILLAAITGEIIANLLTEDSLEFDLGPLDPGRFWQS